MTVHQLGYHRASNRTISSVTLSADELNSEFRTLSLAVKYYTCFCSLDATGRSADELGEFCKTLLRSGCVYFCVWGDDCNRVHDIMDEEVAGSTGSAFDPIMTTDHASCSLPEALEFFLADAQPFEIHRSECRGALVISADRRWDLEIENYIRSALASSTPGSDHRRHRN